MVGVAALLSSVLRPGRCSPPAEGILQHDFMLPCHVDMMVKAVCVLHNYLLSPTDNQSNTEGEQTGRQLQSVRNMGGIRGSREACDV